MPAADPPSPIRAALRSLSAGLLWVGILFGADLWDSWWQLERSARKVQTDEVAMAKAREAIAEYLQGVVGGHLLLALGAALFLHLAVGLWHPTPPRGRRWWGTALALGVLGTLAFYTHDMVLFPQRHSWFPWISTYADLSDPRAVIVAWSALALVLFGLALRRWAGLDRSPLARRVLLLALLAGGWTWATRAPTADPASDNDGPNVVLIGIDGLRPDHLAAFGYEADTAPRIDAFLRESVVFDQSWTVFARTYPSWISLLSGALPLTHGIRDNLPRQDELVPKDVRLLPQVLGERGYHTRFVTDDSRFSYMVEGTGFQAIHQPRVGIQNFAISANEPYFRLVGGLLYNRVGFALMPLMAHNQAHGRTFRPNAFVHEATELLRDSSRHDRFLYTIHSCVLHAPGDRPWPWHQMYGQEGYDGPNRFKYNRAGTTLAPTDDEDEADREAIARQDERLYDAGLDMANRLVGSLLDELEVGGLLDNTIVVVLSDHGEESWDLDLPYRYYGPNHGYHPYGDHQHRTLLAIRFPDGRGVGRLVPDPVRTIDLAPTLAEVLDLPLSPQIEGRSALALVDGAREADPRPVYIETGMTEQRYWNAGHRSYPWKGVAARYRVEEETGRVYVREEFAPHLLAAKDRVYQQGDWKLVWRPMQSGPARVELYDRRNDPVNRHDLAEAEPYRVAKMGLALAALLAQDGIGEPRVPEWALRVGVTPDPALLHLAETATAAVAPRSPAAPDAGAAAAGTSPALSLPWTREAPGPLSPELPGSRPN